jgi:hypothetical protein
MIVCSLDFDFLSARFSLSDFPDFFDMDLRGDLSDIIGPSIGKPERSRCLDGTPHPARTRIVAQHFMTIGGEVPTQAFAITRLLLALPIMMLKNTSQMSPAASCDQMTAEAAAGHVGLQHTCLRVVQRHQRPMGFIRPAVRDPADRRAVCLNG